MVTRCFAFGKAGYAEVIIITGVVSASNANLSAVSLEPDERSQITKDGRQDAT